MTLEALERGKDIQKQIRSLKEYIDYLKDVKSFHISGSDKIIIGYKSFEIDEDDKKNLENLLQNKISKTENSIQDLENEFKKLI